MSGRTVTVRLSATVSSYIQAMEQAERATNRVADAADRLGDININTDSSFASDMDQAASSADNAASSMENTSASAESAASSMDNTGASAQDAAAGMQTAGAAGESAAASVGQVSAASQQTTADMLAISGAAQDAGGGMESAAGSAMALSSNLDGSGGSAQNFSASLSSVGAQAQTTAGDMLNLSASAQSLAGGMDGADSSGSSFLSTAAGMRTEFRQMGGAMAVVGGGMAALAGSVIGTGIAYNGLQQTATQALSVMTDSAADAAEQMDRFDDFARNSPFFRTTWLEAQRQLMAFGVEAERVVPAMEGIEEAVAAIGGGDQEIGRLVDILGQIEGQGQITGRELQRMGQMGIDAAGLMGESLGMTGDEIRTQITAGALDAETAITALTDGMSSRFEGSADAIRNTFQGATNDAIAYLRDLGSVIASPLVDPAGGGFLVDLMNTAADTLSVLGGLPDPLIQVAGLGAAAAGGIGLIGGALMTAAPMINPFITNMGRIYTTMWDFMRGAQPIPTKLRNIGVAAGIAAAAMATIAAANWVWDEFLPDPLELEEVERGLRDLANVGDYSGRITDFGLAFESLNTTGNQLRNNVPGWAAVLADGFGVGTSGAAMAVNNVKILNQELEDFDTAMANAFSSGNFETAAAGMERFIDDMLAADHSMDDVVEALPAMGGALRDAAQDAGVTADATKLLEMATSEAALEALTAGENWTGISNAYEQGEYTAGIAADGALNLKDALAQQAEAANEASEGISDLVGSMNDYAGIALAAEATTDQWLADLRELNEVLNEGEYSLDRNTDAGQDNRAMLRDLAAGTWDTTAAMAEQGASLEEVTGVVDDNIDALTRAGEAAGLSESEIDDMIRTYMGLNDVEPIEIQAENRTQEIFDEVEVGLHELPDDFEIWLDAQDERVQEVIDALLDQDIEATADILGDSTLADAVMDAFEDGDYRAVAELIADDERAQTVVLDFQSGEYIAQVDILGNDVEAHEAIAAILNDDYEALVDIVGGEDEATDVIEAIAAGDYDAMVDALGGDDLATEMLDAIANDDYLAMILAEAATGEAIDALDIASGPRDAMMTASAQVASAELQLDDTARDRVSEVVADPDSTNAEGDLNETARDRIADIIAESHSGIAEGDLNDTARHRISTVLADPDTWNAEGELTDTARNRIARILGEPNTWNARNELDNVAGPRTATMTGNAHTWQANSDLDHAARDRTSNIHQTISRRINMLSGIGDAAGGRADASSVRSAMGLPGYSSGGRLPSTGLGVDQIMGISGSGMPTAMVDDKEWIINRQSSDLYDPLLAAINQNNLPAIKDIAAGLGAFQQGGVVGRDDTYGPLVRQAVSESALRAGVAVQQHRPIESAPSPVVQRQYQQFAEAAPAGGGGSTNVNVDVSMKGAMIGSREVANHLADDMAVAIQNKVINRKARA